MPNIRRNRYHRRGSQAVGPLRLVVTRLARGHETLECGHHWRMPDNTRLYRATTKRRRCRDCYELERAL